MPVRLTITFSISPDLHKCECSWCMQGLTLLAHVCGCVMVSLADPTSNRIGVSYKISCQCVHLSELMLIHIAVCTYGGMVSFGQRGALSNLYPHPPSSILNETLGALV